MKRYGLPWFFAAVMVAAFAAWSNAQEPGLVGSWPFDDGFGDMASDASGGGHDGDVYDGEWVKGLFGTALRLNGTGSYVAIPELSGIDGSDALTLEAWVYWEGSGRYPNIVTLGRWCPGGVLIFVSDRYCSLRLGRPWHEGWRRTRDWKERGLTLVRKIEFGRWYHLVATFDRPTMTTYVNGKRVGRARWDYPIGYKGEVLIGKWGGNRGHRGLIDDVRIYNRALTPAEVKAHYNKTASKRIRTDKPYEIIAQKGTEQPPALILENKLVKLSFNRRLRITRVIDKKTGYDYLARSAAFVSLRTEKRNFRPSSFTYADGKLFVQFKPSTATATIGVKAKDRYFVFEVLSVEADGVKQLTFVNLAAKPSEYVHIMSGLAGDDAYSLCLRCLNLAARPTVGGRPPMLRAACVPEYGMKGARAALVACPTDQLRPVLKEMALCEDVPRSKLGGPFALDAPANRASYMFANPTEDNIDEWIEMAQTACIPFLHFSRWYVSQGHYEPRPQDFPRGMASLKAVVAKVHDAGLLAGMHTLTGCIQPRDPFVSPKPDPRLAKDRVFTLGADVSETADEIPLLEDPSGMDTVWNYSSRGNVVQIGDELVMFRGLKTTPPYVLTKCLRGKWGTPIQAHPKGSKAYHLLRRYAFQPDEHSTLVDEVAQCIVDKVNAAGFDLIYHDGAEGMPGRSYGAAKMRTAIYTRINRPIRVESSYSGLHHCWWFHSCVGAWDHPQWGLKRCVDEHVKVNVRYRKRSLMPAQLGWWAILGPAWWHDAEWPDEVEYLCAKALGNDMSMSFQSLRPSSNPWNARQGEYLKMIGRYEKLRLSGYFDGTIKERLRTPREAFHLTQAADGEWQFLPTDYLAYKAVASEAERRRWTVTNRYAAQKPKLRIEALYSAAPYDSPDGFTLAEFAKPNEFRKGRAAQGVRRRMTIVTDRVRVGQSSACFKATNTTGSRVNTWARMVKTFVPDLNLGRCAAMGVWIYGDGKGEVINFQLRSPRLYHGCYDEHIVKIDFTGWRYFELLLRERTADKHYDYKWPYGHAMRICRTPLATRHVNELNIYYNNLPPNDEVTCYISPIRALPMVKTVQTNPRVTIGGQAVTFPVRLESGQFIEFNSPADCTLRDERGSVLEEVTPQGDIPTLAAGRNTVEFACDAKKSPRPRAKVTIVSSGEPIRGVAKGKEHLKRKLRRLDDYFLAISPNGDIEFIRQDKMTVTRIDGKDNVWTVTNETNSPQAVTALRLRVGAEIAGSEYNRAAAIEDFEDAAAFESQARYAALVVGPRKKGMAKEGVSASFECKARGAKTGRSCGVFRAESALGDRSGWAAVVRRFDRPLDLSAMQALGLWGKGDGKGAWLEVQFRDTNGRAADYYVKLDASTWRYFELRQPAMGTVDKSRIEALVLYLVAVPRKGSTTCWIDGLRALHALPRREVANPRITIGANTIAFPVTMVRGDTLVLKRSGVCRLVNYEGKTRTVPVRGDLPRLRPGQTRVQFTCSGGLGNEVRVSIRRK